MAELLALADLVTPNRPELAALAALAGAARRRPAHRGPDGRPAVGRAGAREGRPRRRTDVGRPARRRRRRGPDLHGATGPTTNTHGTGCSLSSAIATAMARDGDWELAIGTAKTWLTTALRGADALRVGSGTGRSTTAPRPGTPCPPPRWTDRWWADVEPVLAATVSGAFLVGLRDGTLDTDTFARYLAQDVHYLRGYQGHLASLAERTSGAAARFWAEAAAGCEQEARDLHHRRLAGRTPTTPRAPGLRGLPRAPRRGRGQRFDGGARSRGAALLPGLRLGRHPARRRTRRASVRDWLGAYGDPGSPRRARRRRRSSNRRQPVRTRPSAAA